MDIHKEQGERLLLDIPQTAALLGIKKTKAYEMAARGELPVVRVGRLVKIHRPTLEARLAQEAESIVKWVES